MVKTNYNRAEVYRVIVQDIRVTDWPGLSRELFENTWNATIRRYRSDFAYRGMGEASADFRTGLMKLGGNIRQVEFHILRNLKKYAHEDTVREDSQWNWLAVAQHHGVPTRLLDWSYSPYVALHFATEDVERYDNDGIIWCVDYVAIHKLLPKALREVLSEERSNAFTVEMVERAAQSLAALEKLSKEPFAVFLEPSSLDQRIVNQFSIFDMMSSPVERFDEWLLKEHSDLVRRIIIRRN